jgi:predicted CxxxxCH...CXXCH cytochrome family protein
MFGGMTVAVFLQHVHEQQQLQQLQQTTRGRSLQHSLLYTALSCVPLPGQLAYGLTKAGTRTTRSLRIRYKRTTKAPYNSTLHIKHRPAALLVAARACSNQDCHGGTKAKPQSSKTPVRESPPNPMQRDINHPAVVTASLFKPQHCLGCSAR